MLDDAVDEDVECSAGDGEVGHETSGDDEASSVASDVEYVEGMPDEVVDDVGSGADEKVGDGTSDVGDA